MTSHTPLGDIEAHDSPGTERSTPANESQGAMDGIQTRQDALRYLKSIDTDSTGTGASRAAADTQDMEQALKLLLRNLRDVIDNYNAAHQFPVLEKTQVNSQFLDAARNGDVKALERAIYDGADPTATNENSETALHLACRYGHLRIVEKLLEFPSHRRTLEAKTIEAQNIYGETPLLSACSENHEGTLKILELLFQCFQPVIGAKTQENYTALHMACWVSSAAVVNFLVKKGADTNAQDEDGDTPLHVACQYQTLAGVKNLLSVDGRINIKNNHESTALTLACEHNSAEVVRLLLEKDADCNVADSDGDTPLILASRYGSANMVKAVLDCKPIDCDRRNKREENAMDRVMLNMAAREEIVPLLLNRGLQLRHHDALELFSGGTSMKLSGSDIRQSVWVRVVRDMLEFNHLPDKPVQEAIKPILEFARNEEKVFAILDAATEQDFDTLMSLTGELKLSKDVCALAREIGRRGVPDSLEALLKKYVLQKEAGISKLGSATSKEKNIPRSQLQISAYCGEHKLVRYLLMISQSKNKSDIKKALDIAKARKSTLLNNTAKASAQSKNAGNDEPESHTSGNDTYIKRFGRTIDVLNNAAMLVSLPPEKLPERPKAAEMRDKEPVLQQHYASVIDFYGRDGRIDLLRSSPSVFDLIYAEGDDNINDIMEKARSTSQEMYSDEAGSAIKKDNSPVPACHENEKPQLRWIHLPANNMDWMEHLTLRVYENKKKDEKYLKSFLDLAQRSQNELPSEKSKTKFMKPLCLKEGVEITARERAQEAENVSQQEVSAAGAQRLALYTPYVTFGHCYPAGPKGSSTKHSEFLEKYQGRILHGPRSLDRFYYNALSNDKMNERDKSQVVTRGLLSLTIGQPLPEDCKKWPFLTVDQLWVWIIDNETIITSSTHREDEFDDLLVQQIFDQLLEGSQKSIGQKPPSSVVELSHFLVMTCFGFINNLAWRDVRHGNDDNFKEDPSSKPILLWYAEVLNEAAAQEKNLFEVLKARLEEKKSMAMAETKDRQANEDAARLLDEVKDIRDELTILRFLVAQQERVWEGLMGTNSGHHDARSPSFTAHELDDMIKMTDTIQRSIKDLLNLSLVDKSATQSQTLVTLGKRSESQSEANAKQEKILFLFTVVTVIFTPLSFVTSLLALNTSTSRHNDDGELEYEPGWMYRIIFGPTTGFFGLVLLYMAYAFFDNLKKKVKRINKERKNGLNWLDGEMKKGSQRLISSPFWIWRQIERLEKKMEKGFRWLILSPFWVWCQIKLMYEMLASCVRGDGRRSRDVEKGQAAGNRESKPPSVTQPKSLMTRLRKTQGRSS